MKLELQSLPFDVIFSILCHLSPAEITRLGATCRVLQERIASSQIWAEKCSYLRTEFPSKRTPAYQISPTDLRNKVIHEAQVDKLWREISSKPKTVSRIPLNYSAKVQAIDLLPAGNHLLIVLSDGSLDVISLGHVPETSLSEEFTTPMHAPPDCIVSRDNFKVIEYYWIMSSETTGFLLVELSHRMLRFRPGENHTHYRIYALDQNDEPSTELLPLVGDFQLSTVQCSHNWRWAEDKIYHLYHIHRNEANPWFQLALVEPSALSSVGATLPACDFRLTGFAFVSPSKQTLCDFNVISPSRIILAGPGNNISIYELPSHHPPHTGTTPIDISPIWTWTSMSPTFSLYLGCGPVTFNSRCNDAICWVIECSDPEVFHRFVFATGNSEAPVKDHQRFENEVSSPFALGNVRGMSCNDRGRVVTAETVTVSDCVHRGSVDIVLDEGLRYCEDRTFSFEESTGRIMLTVLDSEDKLSVLVADLM